MVRSLSPDRLRVISNSKRTPANISVHVVPWYGEKIIIVKNQSKTIPNGSPKPDIKPEGWGIPTGKVWDNERPFDAALREFREEVNIFDTKTEKMVEIDPEPICGTEKENGYIDIYYSASLDPLVEIPEKVIDPTGNILDIALIDPLKNIEKRGYAYFFRGDIFYRSHITAISLTRGVPI
jgi:8-oxo-dGTP pyrophosphatase MutT (NUDIX family)